MKFFLLLYFSPFPNILFFYEYGYFEPIQEEENISSTIFL